MREHNTKGPRCSPQRNIHEDVQEVRAISITKGLQKGVMEAAVRSDAYTHKAHALAFVRRCAAQMSQAHLLPVRDVQAMIEVQMGKLAM